MTRPFAVARHASAALIALPLLLGLGGCTCGSNGGHEKSHAASQIGADAAQAGLDRFKSLAGEWVDEADASPAPTVQASYRVVSAGSAVVETIFPGAAHEMVTVYHLDNGSLVCTHYCAMGNQPTLECTSASGNVFVFKERSCTNVPNKEAPRMGWAKIDLSSPDRVRSDWRMLAGGKLAEEPKAFNLKRRK